MTTTRTRWDLGALAALPGAALAITALNKLFAAALSQTMEIDLEPRTGEDITLDLGSGALPITDTVTIAVPMADLSPLTVVVLLLAHVVLTVGVLIATFVLATGFNHATQPSLATERGAQLLGRSFWTLGGTFVAYGILVMTGTFTAIGDLGLESFNNGITLVTIITALGALGLVWFLRMLVSGAAAAEADIDGLV